MKSWNLRHGSALRRKEIELTSPERQIKAIDSGESPENSINRSFVAQFVFDLWLGLFAVASISFCSWQKMLFWFRLWAYRLCGQTFGNAKSGFSFHPARVLQRSSFSRLRIKCLSNFYEFADCPRATFWLATETVPMAGRKTGIRSKRRNLKLIKLENIFSSVVPATSTKLTQFPPETFYVSQNMHSIWYD